MIGQAQVEARVPETDGSQPILFPEGLLGFPEVKRYDLVELPKARPFKWLRAPGGEPCFVVVDPREFRPDYTVAVPASDLDVLGLEQPSDAEIYALVVIPEDPSRISANLRGPLVINRRKGLGKQVILLSSAFSTRHLIRDELCRSAGQAVER
ncbi:MAG: flagellar assembly protein FliW [Acetobacteraceae bacterium]|nr:flagellar assembly protein FliW [Acetobacteraceae bacterium]